MMQRLGCWHKENHSAFQWLKSLSLFHWAWTQTQSAGERTTQARLGFLINYAFTVSDTLSELLTMCLPSSKNLIQELVTVKHWEVQIWQKNPQWRKHHRKPLWHISLLLLRARTPNEAHSESVTHKWLLQAQSARLHVDINFDVLTCLSACFCLFLPRQINEKTTH